jgi:hypothetical protein
MLESEPDIAVINRTRFWNKRPWRPQPKSDSMLPEIENPPVAPSQEVEFGRNALSRLAKPAVRMQYNIAGSTLGR